ncbi:hypothetical protein LAZ67_17000948 [Cordylochernes scorpioides]|uniref:Transposase n=1 Tax=Cordylochernes scorpioides TaxID=51811 RepID=A0ABY6LD34_9ARAC|nr:hypothetical protein LAZ67_17000948 [Cordylochernes scorpioides]
MPGHRKRRQFKQTDAFTRGMVIGLKRAGWSIRQIAADTHLGASTVHRLWRRWLEQGNVAIYRNVGATRVTSARVDRRILRQAVAAPQATCTAILQHVQDTLDHSISTRTISRRLVANGLHSCRPLRRLPLTPPNRRQRLEWCRARSTWMTEWHRVVFSDDRVSACPVIVAVYACGVDVEKGPIRQQLWNAPPFDNDTMTAQRYVDDVLRPVTLPYLQGVPNALYQQDNARPHTARISQQALQDVQMLPWPPYSPDLSPIEHVWDIIGRRLHALPQPRSENELWQMVGREWRAIPQDAIRTLIDSLPRRVAACIAVRGQPKAATTPETIEKVHNIVLNERRVKMCEIAEAVRISEEKVLNLLFLTSYLTPVIRSANLHSIRSIPDFIINLRNLKPTPGCIIGSFDVVSLFLSLSHHLIIENLKDLLNQNSTDPIETNRIISLLQLCLSSINFKFEDKTYQQICGSPMGSPLSLIAAEIVMMELDKWINRFGELGIRQWYRYIDDVVCEYEPAKEQLILSTLNSYHPQIKFTLETETKAALPYLDILILRTEQKFHTTVYYKRGLEPSYLNFNSFGPIGHKIAIVKTLTKRVITHCSLPVLKE